MTKEEIIARLPRPPEYQTVARELPGDPLNAYYMGQSDMLREIVKAFDLEVDWWDSKYYPVWEYRND